MQHSSAGSGNDCRCPTLLSSSLPSSLQSLHIHLQRDVSGQGLADQARRRVATAVDPQITAGYDTAVHVKGAPTRSLRRSCSYSRCHHLPIAQPTDRDCDASGGAAELDARRRLLDGPARRRPGDEPDVRRGTTSGASSSRAVRASPPPGLGPAVCAGGSPGEDLANMAVGAGGDGVPGRVYLVQHPKGGHGLGVSVLSEDASAAAVPGR
ncbi:hypothetical protein DL767_003527 [Monosporascus sp. MG133]|nr:hypothetical protein DL767_003527 [Monosporascus sp. MG133]